MVISSIDLMDGHAVQLVQGKKKVLEVDNPVELAGKFLKFGEIAVIDLDAALGKGSNDLVIKEICRIADCRVGGGIRSIKRAKEVVSYGAEKIIIGTCVFNNKRLNYRFLKELVETIGKDRIIIAIDAYNGEIVTRGWRFKTGLNVSEVLKELEPYCSELLFTCVEREGKMKGTDIKIIKKLISSTPLNITVAGGISSITEIEELSVLGVNIQIGMAIYSGKISMADAFIASVKWDPGLVPAIAVDTSSQVLMQAYMNRESLKKTFETGEVWYYSRSRKRLWKKGETSGNVQFLTKIRRDCDGDALLLIVNQKSYACHTGSYSCFGSKNFFLNELYDVIKCRIKNFREDSYTATLTSEVLREKIIEESHELIEANKKKEIIWEAADLFYFIIVLLAKEGVTLKEVFDELKRRRRSPG